VSADVVTRHDGHLSISATECWVDCWALERLPSAIGGDSSSLVEQVRRLYAGPFLSGEDDAPWALQLRERLHVALVKKLSVMAADALAHGRVDMAHEKYDAGLEIDDLVEESYRGQIHCHIAADQPSLAVTTYRRCQRTLSKRLGVEPSAGTARLYLSAIRAQGE
jgi:DNA-binding SARP family transcriptional activator